MEELLQLLVPLILAHPRVVAYVTLILGALTAISNAWQAIPVATREAWERRWPRPIGALRTFVELGTNVVKAARIARHQAIEGKPRLTEPALVPDAPNVVVATEPGTSGR